ncbi:dethiobiotin synthase [Chlorobaculum parvum NCIB 8327]|uniref:ATP-dependent dethiobiotin synthetase BioD n=1 Tax=Chlorobaculum parvum (strain DSM 263 / NCIMB 8327) TaxID=517417 RepID=B3QLR3_CHLP8|nr:dethiobiotin synthase [Chlorobaculum parvum]ACF12399.1 dethiobiotin synthase [Chlorobaculum parvum NCIB 8327]
MRGVVIAVGGIDTGIGKTAATGQLARYFAEKGLQVITQKIVQTGCEGISEDIVEHRRIMGSDLQEVDLDGSTCPYVFRFPASPHLAAALEGSEIDFMEIRRRTFRLQLRYDLVLLEGVGGLLVPLTPELLFADYVRDAGYGLVLVSSSRLGSINHTLLSLEACASRGIEVRGVVYNRFFEADELIASDTRKVIAAALKRYGFGNAPLVDLDAEGRLSDPEALVRIINPQND